MTCGERRTYQAGCRCDACTAAHRAYRQRYREAYRHGRPPLGARISAAQTWRIIRALLAERYTKQAVARLLGLRGKSGALKLGTRAVTVRTYLKVRRLHRVLQEDDATAIDGIAKENGTTPPAGD